MKRSRSPIEQTALEKGADLLDVPKMVGYVMNGMTNNPVSIHRFAPITTWLVHST